MKTQPVEFVYPRGRDPAKSPTLVSFCFRELQQSGLESSVALDLKRKVSSSPIVADSTNEKLPTSSRESLKERLREGTEDRKGDLYILSIEDAIRDKKGSRPRANSTDGELKLPRRGLCDEGTVLRAYQWAKHWGVSPPRGFVNLGNTCYLNSTLQCLAHLPALCQCLVNLQPRKSEKRITQGQRISLQLRSLFRQVHGLQKSKTDPGNPIAPRGVVSMVPMLGRLGNRSGYKFRPGRQEDAHEFLVHLLEAMHDGELKGAGEKY